MDWEEGIPWFVISGSPNKSRARAKGLGLELANYVLKFRFISFAPILSTDIATLINIL